MSIIEHLRELITPYTIIGKGRKTVAAVGDAESLVSTPTACKVVIITAETDNTGVVTVGSESVIAALATREGTPLFAGDSMTIKINNLNKIYLDVTVAGDGVTYLYLGR